VLSLTPLERFHLALKDTPRRRPSRGVATLSGQSCLDLAHLTAHGIHLTQELAPQRVCIAALLALYRLHCLCLLTQPGIGLTTVLLQLAA